jgi:hypothetical protein
MEKKLTDILERTLKATTPLAEMGAVHDTAFVNVLLGIYRVSFTTLRDIYYLSLQEETGPSTLDLARKIIEYGIVVEYMIWKGKEEKAEQFQKYWAAEMHHTLGFLKSIGQDVSQQSEELREGAKEAERAYAALSADTKGRRNWAGLSIEQMMEQLHTAGHFKEFDNSRISEAYIWGCRLNHVSPIVVRNYLEPETATVASDFYLRQAIMFGILFHLRLSTRYIDEMRTLNGSNVHQEIADSVVTLRDELDNFVPESK